MKTKLLRYLLITSSFITAHADTQARFKKASTPSESRKILIADDFENGISPAVQKLLHCEDPQKVAGLSISSETVASGSNALKITSSPTVEHGFMPSLSQWFKGEALLKNGTLTVSFDCYIPQDSPAVISLEARDYSVKPAANHFQSVITPIGFRLAGTSKAFTPNQWTHFEYKIPIKQSSQKITCTITQQDGVKKLISIPAPSVQAISWIGIMLLQKKQNYAYLDNLVIALDQ